MVEIKIITLGEIAMIQTNIGINGMMCGMCESHINDVIRQNFKIKKVTSSHKKGLTQVISQNELDTELIKKVIEATGYTVNSIESSEYEKKISLFGKHKG